MLFKNTEKKILKILQKINIDELLTENKAVNLIDSKAISKVIVKKDSATFAIDIGILNIGSIKAKALEEKCKEEVIKNTDLKSVNIILTSATNLPKEETKNKFNEKAGNSDSKISEISGVKNVIAIASGKGGVGKSTVAVNLALSLKRIGFKVGIVDADIYGPSIPHMMNLKGKPRVEGNLMIPLKNYDIDCISIGSLIDIDKALVWRGPMVTKTLYQLIRGVKWQDIDYLIVDLPPGTGDTHLTMAQQFPIQGVVIVSTPQDVAVIDAIRSIDMFKTLNIPILGVVQNMAYIEDEKTGDKNYLFGKDGAKNMAKKAKVKFLGDIALDIKIRKAGDDKNPITNLEPSSKISFEYGKIAENIIEF